MLREMKAKPSELVSRYRNQPHFVGRELLVDEGAEHRKVNVHTSTERATKSAHLEATRKILGDIV